MKNLFFGFILFGFISNANAQEVKVVDEIESMVYPGCEKEKTNALKKSCFEQQIKSSILGNVQNYMEHLEYLNVDSSEAILKMFLSKEGKLVLQHIAASEPLYKDYIFLSFEDLNHKLNSNKKKIIPAKNAVTGNPVVLNMSIPINYQLFEYVEETDNRLITILQDEDATYEIVLTPDKKLKIYEIQENRAPLYLGSYQSLLDIKNTLPYKNLIQDKDELITLAQSDFNDMKLVLQVKNIFHHHQFYTLFIVSEVKGKKIKQLRKFNKLKDFKESPYYDWLIRNYKK